MTWAINFVKESYGELRKAAWLTRQEVAQSTIVVVLLVCLMSVYVGAVDFVLSIVLTSVLGGR